MLDALDDDALSLILERLSFRSAFALLCVNRDLSARTTPLVDQAVQDRILVLSELLPLRAFVQYPLIDLLDQKREGEG